MEEKISLGKEFIKEAINMATLKEVFTSNALLKFILRAAMAGLIISFGYVIYILIDSNFANMILADGSSLKPLGHFISSWLFGLCLVLIYYTKSELLTSNMMLLSVANYYNEIKLIKILKIMFYTFLGNFLGGLFVAILLANSTIITSDISLKYIEHVIHIKQTYVTSTKGVLDLLIRAIWCNFFINIAMMVVYSNRIKENVAKIFMMMSGVFFFMYMGLEHSIANTVFFTTAAMIEFFNPTINLGFSPSLAFFNVIIVLIGNFIGGGILIGYYYSFLNDSRSIKS